MRYKNLLRLVALSFFSLTLVGCATSSGTYNDIEVTRDDNTVIVGIEEAGDVAEATEQITRLLVNNGFAISESDQSAGFVQTERREVSSSTLDSSPNVRLNFNIIDAETVNVSGEYFGPASGFSAMMADSNEEWRAINFGGPSGSSEGEAWEAMIRTVEEIGEIHGFQASTF